MIFIDSKVGSADLIDYPPLTTIGQLVTLDSGDLCFTGYGPNERRIMIGIEVKSIPDIIQSRRNGRLFGTQIPRMHHSYRERYFIAYGAYRCNDSGHLEIECPDWRGNVTWTTYPPGNVDAKPYLFFELESTLMMLQRCGLYLRHVTPRYDIYSHSDRVEDCKHQIARYVYALYAKWQKPYAHQLACINSFDNSQKLSKEISDLPNFAKASKSSKDQYTAREAIAEIAKSLPGIGQKRAWAVADTFESPIEMVNAPESAWSRVPGVAAKTATKVYRWLRMQKDRTD